jgi:hypothetical protein
MQYVAIFHHEVAIKDKNQYINPCCYGGDVIGNLLQPRLRDAGFTIDLFDQEDWGWFLWLKKGKSGYSIDIGLEEEAQWKFKLFVVGKQSFLTQLFKKDKQPHLKELCQIIDSTLRSIGIDDLSWWEADRNGTEINRITLNESDQST